MKHTVNYGWKHDRYWKSRIIWTSTRREGNRSSNCKYSTRRWQGIRFRVYFLCRYEIDDIDIKYVEKMESLPVAFAVHHQASGANTYTETIFNIDW